MNAAAPSEHITSYRRATPPMGWCARGALAVLALMVLVAMLAPYLVPFDPLEQDLMLINSPPGGGHVFGTDSLGRDILSRLIMGARLSFSMSAGATALALLLGLGLGGLACAFGRVSQGVYFAVVDLIRSMPGILLCMVLLVALGSGTVSVVIALAITFMPLFAHMALGAYQREMSTDYVRIARGYGTGMFRLLRVHLLPNIAGVFITQSTIILARVIVTESVLSFLGLGVQPETPTWGRMVAIAVGFIEEAPHAAIVPVAALVVTTMSLVVLGDWLRIRFDPIRNS